MELPTSSEQQIVEFAALYEREFSVRLTSEESSDVATRFLQLYWLLTRKPEELASSEELQQRVQRRRRRAKSRVMKRSTKLIKH